MSRTVSYMSASGPFSTQWQAAPDKGLPARKSDVSQLSVTGPHARTSRLRMQEVSCAFCGKVAAKLKKCGRCKRTFYCSREHQEKVRSHCVFVRFFGAHTTLARLDADSVPLRVS